MPKDTFLNLTEEKKKHMESILLNAFYDKHVSQVRVSEIVDAMGMSRGAFYKYFQDLEDAYTYIIRSCSNRIHADILTYIDENKKDFFTGVEKYLSWCSHLKRDSAYWRSIKLLTQGNDLSAYKRGTFSEDSPMIRQWTELLALNHFKMDSCEEAVSFLYFVMALVMDTLTDYIVNEWSEAVLIQEFRFKRSWLVKGLG